MLSEREAKLTLKTNFIMESFSVCEKTKFEVRSVKEKKILCLRNFHY